METINVQPISRARMSEVVARTLRQQILSGRFAPGESLRLEELARQLQVSIMPVREALLALSHDGLVELEAHKGFRAKPLTYEDKEQLVLVHASLSGILAEKAAAVITAADIARLKANDRRFVEALGEGTPDTAHLFDLNWGFHRIINKSVDAPRIHRILRDTSKFMRPDSYGVEDSIKNTRHGHPQVIQALEAREGAAARHLIYTHLLGEIEIMK